jgi:glutathione peroxidase
MRSSLGVAAVVVLSTAMAAEPPVSVYSFRVKDAEGQTLSLAQYEGKVLLIVNVASKCGFTPQYEGLQALYEKYAGQGLVILGFPCNQFGSQEPGTNTEIQSFCKTTYGVTFPVMDKVEVNGDHADPFYIYLKSQASGFLGSAAIKWNFTKFLVDRHGKVVERFASATTPAALVKQLEKQLAMPVPKKP